jgi:hypothetical protein
VKFTLSDIPDASLKRLGVDRVQLLQWPRPTLQALLSGMRTSLIRFTDVRPMGEAVGRILDARLSLVRKPDGSTGVHLHPASPSRTASPLLQPVERQQLEQGPDTVVGKTLTDGEGRPRNAWVAHDSVTGSDVAVDRDALKAPQSLNGQPLTEAQRNDWKEGKPVDLGQHTYRFDPTRENGMRIDSRLKVSHSRLEATDVGVDIALLASGLGTVILLEHIVDTALHLRWEKDRQRLSDPAIRDTLARSVHPSPNQGLSRTSSVVQSGEGKPDRADTTQAANRDRSLLTTRHR